MIQNLNPVSFQGFGTILPEQGSDTKTASPGESMRTLHLKEGSANLYQADQELWLCSGSGMTVLSVSLDNETFRDYYLDKLVCIHKGVYYSLAAYYGGATARWMSSAPLKKLGTRIVANDFSVVPQLRVERLYTFFYHEKERGFVFSGESHSMLELTYVDQGTVHSVVDGKDLLLGQGDMVLYAPNQWHMQYADKEAAPRFITVSFDASGADISSLFGRVIKPPQSTAALLQQMLREQEKMDSYSCDMIALLLTQILLLLLRSADVMEEKPKSSNSFNNENLMIRRAQQFISEHVRERLSVPTVARSVDISPSYLTALFHKHLQISPGEYIRRIKLQESKQMIREDSLNFTQIAAALQYSTVHHFSRQFKENFGITPTEYAKSVK